MPPLGDPMLRPDLTDLIQYAVGTGLTVALTPSGTAAATPARLAALKEAGLPTHTVECRRQLRAPRHDRNWRPGSEHGVTLGGARHGGRGRHTLKHASPR